MSSLFAGRLRQARELRGLSLRELASACSYKHRSSIWALETGKTSPTLQQVRAFALALNVDEVWLSGLSGKGREPSLGDSLPHTEM